MHVLYNSSGDYKHIYLLRPAGMRHNKEMARHTNLVKWNVCNNRPDDGLVGHTLHTFTSTVRLTNTRDQDKGK
jgi:hypothetical protein